MRAAQAPPPDPWRELARRRVVRVAALYAAITFALCETALWILPLTAAPDWAFRAVLGTLVMGFPPSMVLAWRYDVTPGGIVKTPEYPGSEPEVAEQPGHWVAAVLLSTLLGVVIEVVRSP